MKEVIITIDPNNWIRNIGKKYPTIPMRFLGCATNGSQGKGLVELIGNGDLIMHLIHDIENHPCVSGVEITRSKTGGILMVITAECPIAKIRAETGCFIVCAQATDGLLEWRLLADGDGGHSKIIGKLRETGCKVELVKSSRLNGNASLTPRQKEMIYMAFKKGYFDYPKGISIRGLAEEFNVAISTLSWILRRGEKKILAEYLEFYPSHHILPNGR